MFDFKKANNIPISVKLDKLPKNQYAMIFQFRLDLEPEKEIGISMSDKMKEIIESLIIRLNIDKPKLQLRWSRSSRPNTYIIVKDIKNGKLLHRWR